MFIFVSNPIEEAVKKCVTHPKYRVGIIVYNIEDKYSVEDAVKKAIFSAYFGKTHDKCQLTRFHKTEYGVKCEFLITGSAIDCIVLRNNEQIRGRRYHMLISSDEIDERIRSTICQYNVCENHAEKGAII